jgi:hypothetical protein
VSVIALGAAGCAGVPVAGAGGVEPAFLQQELRVPAVGFGPLHAHSVARAVRSGEPRDGRLEPRPRVWMSPSICPRDVFLVMLDGVVLSCFTSLSELPDFDPESVVFARMIRGPVTGTMFGSRALHFRGVVVITTEGHTSILQPRR